MGLLVEDKDSNFKITFRSKKIRFVPYLEFKEDNGHQHHLDTETEMAVSVSDIGHQPADVFCSRFRDTDFQVTALIHSHFQTCPLTVFFFFFLSCDKTSCLLLLQ